ncbi:MAG: hypothetical protein HZB26_09135 [Candidatus Hydrogenedentes bacterium]|nr:hypothetical protein [Candidatus Hydrogenedentota bacterium]
MSSAKGWLGGIAVVLLVVCVAAFILLRWVTGQRRNVAIAEVQALIAKHGIVARAPCASDSDKSATTPVSMDNAGEARALIDHLADVHTALRNADNDGYISCRTSVWRVYFELSTPEELAASTVYADADAYLERSQELLKEVRRFALLAGSLLESEYSHDIKAFASHQQTYHELSVVLVADAGKNLRAHRPLDAIEDIKSANRLLAATASAPYMHSLLGAFDTFGLAFDLMEDSINAAQLTPQAIRDLAETLPSADVRDVALRAAANESVGTEYFYDGLRSGKLTAEYLEVADENRRSPDEAAIPQFAWRLLNRVYVSPLGEPWRSHEQGVEAQRAAAAIEAIARPYYEVILGPDSYSDYFSRRGLSVPYGQVVRELAQYAAQARIAHIAISLELYRSEHGQYPLSLDAIVADNGGAAATDPFSGKPLRYQLTENGFVLYSVGPNQKDDAGVARASDGEDDIVWRIGK